MDVSWFTTSLFAFLFLCWESWASSLQLLVPLDADSCPSHKRRSVSNEPRGSSSYGATMSRPPDPNPSPWTKYALRLPFRNKNEACCRHRGAVKKCIACKHGFALLKLNKSAFLFRDHLHRAPSSPAYVHDLKSKNISQQLWFLEIVCEVDLHLCWVFVNSNMLLFNSPCFDVANV